MANFSAVSDNLLKNVPNTFSRDWQDVLNRPGTYALFKPDNWQLVVPNNEDASAEKGRQARLIGMWGGYDGGQRLDVRPVTPMRGLNIELVSETPVARHLWLWCVTAELPQCLARTVETKLVGVTTVATPGKAVGTVHAGETG